MNQEYTGLQHGYGAPFIRVYYQDQEVTANVDDFTYEYYEEGDDVCKLTLKFEDRETADLPQWQERTELKLIWGFIGDKMPPRKIYIQQIKWDFEKDGIKATIEATEKAVSMKYQDSQEIHKNISLLGLAKKFADRHSLKALLEMDKTPTVKFLDTNTNPEPFSQYLVRNRKALADWERGIINNGPGLINGGEKNSQSIPITDEMVKQVETGNIKDLADFINNYNKPKTQYEKDIAKGGYQFAKQQADKAIYGMVLDNVPQANKTDAQILDETARKTPGGPWIIDTRDDELIIKKRNYNQTPYKSYTFGGDEGSIIAFSPVSKTRSRLPKAMNIGYQYWDPTLKSIVTGNANPENQEAETNLSTYVQVYKFYKNAQDAGLGSKRIGDMPPEIVTSGNKYNTIARSDNTINETKIPLFKFQDINTRVDALKKAIEDTVQGIYNNTFNPAAVNAVDAYNQANNLRKENELKLNPATATIYGDPNLLVGRLITIMGVSKKYSSNYYIIKATHKINKNQGYIVSLEMATQGVNVKASKQHKKYTGSINRTIGPEVGNVSKRKIPIKTNP